MKRYAVDLCVIGAGSAGLSLAAGAAQLGLSVVLFEAGEMGGDCLNTGCVPSKALIAAAHAAQAMRTVDRFGIAATEPRVDWARVQAHVRGVIVAIAPHDSQERFEQLGVTVIREHARFTDSRTVISSSTQVRARRFAIATGSRAALPPIPGLATVGALTNETVFGIDALPQHLLILGGGAIGVELGQAFRRLGAEVTIIEAAVALANADREAAAIVLARLKREGVVVHEGAAVDRVERSGDQVALQLRGGLRLEGSHLLVAAGRTPALGALDLDKAGVAHTRAGVTVSPTLRSVSNPRVWALGDAAGGAHTHTAGWHASAFVRNVLFKARTAAASAAIPSVVYADPELAQIGLTEAQARDTHGDRIKVVRWDFENNDRAQAQRDTEGFCKLMTGKGGKILGATIVGAEAGELIAPVALAMSSGLTIRALTGPVLPYPTRSEIAKRAAGAFYTPTLFSPGTRTLVSILKRIP